MTQRKVILIKGSREVLHFHPPLPCESARHIKVFVPFTPSERANAKPGKHGHILTVRRDSLRTINPFRSAKK